MLNKIITIVFVITLSACSSKPTENSFVGAGEFNAEEAAKTRVSLGLTYLKNGNFSQAKFNLDKALEFAPRSGEAHYAMAFYYQKVEEVTRAEEYYQSAIGYSRNDPDVLNSYGAFLCEQGQYDKAKSFFLKAVDDKSYIATASTYENLALCAQNQGLAEEAKNYFNAALNHQPTRASTLFYLTQNHIQSGQWDEAKKSLWKYERNATVSAESLWMSYQIAQGTGNVKGATEYAEILQRLYPNHENTAKALVDLGKFQPSMSVTQKQKMKVQQQPDSIVVLDTTSEAGAASTLVSASNEAPAPFVPKLYTEQLPRSAESDNAQLGTNLTKDNTQTQVNTAQAVESQANLVDTAPTVAEETPAFQKPEFHVVLPKENLYRISLKYNVKMQKLLEWNNLTDAASIRIGTKLRVRDPNTNE